MNYLVTVSSASSGKLSITRIKKQSVILVFLLFAVACSQAVNAQVYLKSTLIGSSKYNDANSGNTSSKGSAYVIRGGCQLPLLVKVDTVIRGADTIPSQTVWAVRFDGSYTRFNNENMDRYNFPGDVYNYRAGVVYMHSLNKKWSLYSTLGAGLYTTSSGISANQIIGEGALIFIRAITPNLKVGAGVAFDNTFGFPMVYPGLIVDWAIDGMGGKYFARLNSNEIKAGIKYSEKFQLYVNFDAFGASALYKEKMFTHLYYAVGITPEFKVGKYFSMPVTVGVTASRNVYSHDRNLTDFFSYMAKEHTPHFAMSPYVSIGINYKYN
jgi:hypothetical protein